MDLLVPVYECNTNQMKKLGGAGDLGKLFCGDVNHLISSITQTRQQLKQATNDPNPHADCIIYSLGSNGQFGFEEEVKKTVNDRCEIHTFDCTGVWSNPSTTFHNWCLGIPPAGTAEHDKPRFKTLWQITQELNHSYVSLLKMDIEGAEYTVFRSMFTPENSHLLPVAIFVEMHTHLIANLDSFLPEDYVKHQNWAKPLWELVKTLDEYGYVIIAKERNEWGPDHSKCCAEYLFLRIKQVQGLDLKKVSGFGR